MGRYYHGDIEGKFWFAMMNSNVASVFGDNGEDMFYCEAKEAEIRSSEIDKLSQEEQESLCSEPSYIYYNYYYDNSNGEEHTNFEIEVLQSKIKEVQELISKYAELMDTRREEERSKENQSNFYKTRMSKILRSKQYIQKLKILNKLIEARKLKESTISRYEEMLFYLADFLSFQNNIKHIQPICEVAMGSKIFSKLLRSGKCVFEGEM